jgi:hypothetical protein
LLKNDNDKKKENERKVVMGRRGLPVEQARHHIPMCCRNCKNRHFSLYLCILLVVVL